MNPGRRRFLVPEVVQTSNMDCGPATLKALLEGFGIRANYGRLREACQTDVDGTSIDTIEEVANQLGLEAEQIMLPRDHVFLEASRALPAVAVIVQPNGNTHFVVVWSRHGRFVQLMDPAVGRRWVPAARFLDDLYIHKMPVPAADWREYAGSPDFQDPLRERLDRLGFANSSADFIADANSDYDWKSLAALDAAARLLESLVDSGAIPRGPETARLLESFLEHDATIAEPYWSVQPTADEDKLLLRGAVLIRIVGRKATPGTPSSPELVAALGQRPARPGRELLHMLAADGLLTPSALAAALALASGAVIIEAILFRGLLGLGTSLIEPRQRFGAIAAIAIFSFALLLVEIPVIGALLRVGRRLEVRLRLAFLRKIPRLPDRYFQSRLKSDMAERSHSIHLIRRLPELGGQLLRYTFS